MEVRSGKVPAGALAGVGLKEFRRGWVGRVFKPSGWIEKEGFLDHADVLRSDVLNV